MFFFFNYKHFGAVVTVAPGQSAAVAGSEGGTYARDVTVWKKKRRKVYAPDKYVRYPAKPSEVVLKEVVSTAKESSVEIVSPKAAKAISYLGRETKKIKRKLPKTVIQNYTEKFVIPAYTKGLIRPKPPSEEEKKATLLKALQAKAADERRRLKEEEHKSKIRVSAAIQSIIPPSKEEVINHASKLLEEYANKIAEREESLKTQYMQSVFNKFTLEDHIKRLSTDKDRLSQRMSELEDAADTALALLAAGEEEAAIAFLRLH